MFQSSLGQSWRLTNIKVIACFDFYIFFMLFKVKLSIQDYMWQTLVTCHIWSSYYLLIKLFLNLNVKLSRNPKIYNLVRSTWFWICHLLQMNTCLSRIKPHQTPHYNVTSNLKKLFTNFTSKKQTTHIHDKRYIIYTHKDKCWRLYIKMWKRVTALQVGSYMLF